MSPAPVVRRHAAPRLAGRRWRLSLLVALLLVGLAGALLPGTARAGAGTESLFGSKKPSAPVAADKAAVTLGTEVTVKTSGRVLGVRYYLGPGVGKTRVTAGVYSEAGTLLGRRSISVSKAGWHTAVLDKPVTVAAGTRLTVAAHTNRGRYVAAYDYPFPARSTSLTATRGVYAYGTSLRLPEQAYRQSNYFVDLSFAPTAGAPTPTPTPTPSPTASPSPSPTSSPTPPPVPTTAPSGSDVRALPKVPWNGGAAYWSRFAKPAAAGWDDPSFFPVGVWWSGVSSDAEVAFDKGLGLNFYTQMNPDTDYRLIEKNGMFWVGGSELRNLSSSSPGWVGSFLDDEVDGRFEPVQSGFDHLQALADQVPPAKTGRFRYTNYTSGVLTYDRKPADAEKYVNAYTDAVSVDQYFYSVPQCDWPVNWSRYTIEIPKATCRTSHSYGVMVDALTARDAADGQPQAVFNFVENASPFGSTNGHHDVDGDQIQGAVMSSLIHGARGIVWFNQQFEGSCPSGNYFRRAQVEPQGCAAANTAAARRINLLVKQMAPVLNTQSSAWRFGDGLDTMLKVKDGYAYVFAMTDGTSGRRTLTLPAGLDDDVEVVGEGRTLTASSRTFEDSFAKESDFHIYKVRVVG